MTCAYIRVGTVPSGGIRPTSYRSCAITDSCARPSDAGRKPPNGPRQDTQTYRAVTYDTGFLSPPSSPWGTRRTRDSGHVVARGHQDQWGPGRNAGADPAASRAAVRTQSTTRSDARHNVSSVTSSDCQSPDWRKKVATRYGATPLRSSRSKA